MFKKGDTVKCIRASGGLILSKVYTVNSPECGGMILIDSTGSGWLADRFELAYPKAHKHREVIIAWANGEAIQHRHGYSDGWHNTQTNPGWHESTEYRVKPSMTETEIKIEALEVQAKELATTIEELKACQT
jgi:hypothetical protein